MFSQLDELTEREIDMFQPGQVVEPFDSIDVIVVQIDLLESGQLLDTFDSLN